MRVLINAENASMRMSGETSIPLYYFNRLRERHIDVWMVCHSRVRQELRELFPNDEDFQKIQFVEDSWLQAALYRLGHLFPHRIDDLIIGQLIHILTQMKARSIAKQMIQEFSLDLVFEPAPIAPKAVSFMYDMGVPVVLGPLCGGLTLPPAFRYMDSRFTRWSIHSGRLLSLVLHRLIPGKLKADVLLVGNQRTAKVLPTGYQGQVHEVVESGVDLALWQPIDYAELAPGQPVRFVFFGRFVDWKGLQFLVKAFKPVAERTNSVLELIGDGELFEATKEQVASLNLQDRVNFHGRLPLATAAELIRNCHVYMAPALRECGGCALLEAMAMGLPVIAANWAGPGEYVQPTCGVLVDPTSEKEFVDGLSNAMIKLAESPELRKQMGQASQQRVRSNYFDWDSKVDRVVEIFKDVVARSGGQVSVDTAQPSNSNALSSQQPVS